MIRLKLQLRFGLIATDLGDKQILCRFSAIEYLPVVHNLHRLLETYLRIEQGLNGDKFTKEGLP